MVQRSVVLMAALVLLLSGHSDAEWFAKLRRDTQRNRCWPEPFLRPDRVAGRAPFAIMINKGWQMQNTLGDDHFDPGSGMLNEAGQLKVHDILTYSPPEHRTVYVLQDTDAEVTAARNRSVTELVSKLQPLGQGLLVAGTNIRPRTSSADYVNSIGTKFNESTPDPRLPAASSAGMSGGSGSSSGGGGGY
jgi:hypothetical protein